MAFESVLMMMAAVSLPPKFLFYFFLLQRTKNAEGFATERKLVDFCPASFGQMGLHRQLAAGRTGLRDSLLRLLMQRKTIMWLKRPTFHLG